MHVFAYLIEYSIIGSISLVWQLPLLARFGINFSDIGVATILLVPSLCGTGLVLDAAGHFLTLRQEMRLRVAANKEYLSRYRVAEFEHAVMDAGLFARSPDLARAVAVLAGRARVARGIFVNSLVATLVFPFLLAPRYGPQSVVLALLGGGLMVVALWIVWSRWQRFAYRYQIKAVAVIEEQFGAAGR